ncbi:MAG: hypothetical protein H7Z38_02630 [Rubrivivax sp.]|nr:hypothetical protein [Pyrinomonadaceae bacterium]
MATVKRVQKAVTAEVHAYVNATRTSCQVAALPPEYRQGKPQAIKDMAQKNLEKARQEKADAYSAAAGCDTSRIIIPQISGGGGSAGGSADAYRICIHADDEPCDGFLRMEATLLAACMGRNHRRQAEREGTCAAMLEKTDCTGMHVVGGETWDYRPISEEDKAFLAELEFRVNKIEPECREAYLELKAARHEQERTQEYMEDIGPKFSSAGPKGYEIYKRALANRDKAQQKKIQAEKKLKACQELLEDNEAETGTGEEQSDTQNKQKNVRPCNADEKAAFAQMLGSWRSISLGPNMTISGSCEQATGTEKYAEYCERPDATYNATLKRYEVKFTGRMEGESLQVAWTPDSTDTRSTAGSGSCRVSPDGTLSCSGIPCGINAKKQ